MKKEDDNFEKELNDLPSFLRQLKKEGDAFSTPTNYFDGLGERYLSAMKEEEALTPKVSNSSNKKLSFGGWLRSWIFQPFFGMSVVACAIVLVTVSYLRQQVEPNMEISSSDLFAELSVEEVDAYIVEHIDDFDEDLFVTELEINETIEEIIFDMDTSITPTIEEAIEPVRTDENTIRTNEVTENPYEGMSADELLEGITAEDVQWFMDEEGMIDDLFEDID